MYGLVIFHSKYFHEESYKAPPETNRIGIEGLQE